MSHVISLVPVSMVFLRLYNKDIKPCFHICHLHRTRQRKHLLRKKQNLPIPKNKIKMQRVRVCGPAVFFYHFPLDYRTYVCYNKGMKAVRREAA